MGRKKDITDSTEHKKIITVTAVTVLNDYMLKVTFSSKETKIFDFKPYLSAPSLYSLKRPLTFFLMLYKLRICYMGLKYRYIHCFIVF